MIFRVLWWILCIFEWVVLWQNIHIIGAWLNWLSIKALPNSLALSSFKYFLIALQAWCLTGQCGINFWYVFDNLRLSIVIPSNWISTDTLTIIDPIFRLYFKRFFFPSTIHWTFPGFALMSSFKLIWVNFEPIKKIFISSRLLRNQERLLPWENKMLSSAKLQMSDFSTTRKMSLIKILESKGANMESWEIPRMALALSL